MTEKILILGGTEEAAKLATKLVKTKPHAHIITSLAGRTKQPAQLVGEVRIGGFGGISGLAAYLEENNIDCLIDATHPFAKQISAHAIQAAQITNIPLKIYQRPAWEEDTSDNWISVIDHTTASNLIPANARVLLALGSQHIGAFSHRSDVHFVIRMIDKPKTTLPFAQYSLIIGRPFYKPEQEAKLLQDNAITHIVCRNSGGSGAYAKIIAARELKLPVIMIQR